MQMACHRQGLWMVTGMEKMSAMEGIEEKSGAHGTLAWLKDKRVLLASASPRRRELLGKLCVDVHQADVRPVDESFPHTLAPEDVAPYISRKKAEAYLPELAADEVLVTADTVVISHGEVMGKPHGEAEACEMLQRLSGHTHKVVTGVTVASSGGRMKTFSETTEVEFANLTPDEITFYVKNFRPFDKAGAYGIQEWIGYIGIKGIRGDYYNVMGMPLHALYRVLCRDF